MLEWLKAASMGSRTDPSGEQCGQVLLRECEAQLLKLVEAERTQRRRHGEMNPLKSTWCTSILEFEMSQLGSAAAPVATEVRRGRMLPSGTMQPGDRSAVLLQALATGVSLPRPWVQPPARSLGTPTRAVLDLLTTRGGRSAVE